MDSERLVAIAFFAELSADELERVAAAAFPAEAEQGQTLVQEGDFGHALFAIEHGTAEVRVGGQTVNVLGPGDIFGEIASTSAATRTASVVATTPMRLITLFKRDVWALERQAPDVAARLRTLASERLAKQRPRVGTS